MSKKEEQLEPFILTQGNHFSRDDEGNLVENKPGDTVLLTAKQAVQLQDKVKSKEVYQAEKKIEQAHAKALKDADAKLAADAAKAQAKLRAKLDEDEEEGEEEEENLEEGEGDNKEPTPAAKPATPAPAAKPAAKPAK